ncbi:MAG TPA: SCO family protein [Sediminibacterium sp.]|jgi:protein SCO1/2|uniref:SCO family protein n=1 Tax=Sediminibacterium sp. TaxID=1917865 RepID=UPI0008BDECF6|nr:SCO family protein [Sediminibacterium sp.]OHC86913.1 MAG: electron transporter [Sphingobacteriia bacterium RIFOXYC2_FULL_35_18]OHC88230.1 MAG: electron transporter [Sphingobacteriia bacterium RIFOXYD2_FULL_35_12]HLD51700.1 SCO family protein [Sediminibacterium sp.]HQS23016.1 SCO family protein [Sediminibacterium sp.]HQS33812.1 SCO family protein [Sediminibacterium sp.]
MLQTAFLKISLCSMVLLGWSCANQQKKSASLPFYNTPDFTPVFLANHTAARPAETHYIPAFEFTNQYGERITNQTVQGKVHVASFIFTRCGSICPKMIHHLKQVATAFENDTSTVLLSYSVTPWIDSVPRLKFFTEENKIGQSYNWHFLTGDKASIYTLARKGYFAEEDLGFTKDSTEFLHTEHVLLVDQKSRIRGIYNGTLQLEIEQLIKDIQLLKQQ